VAHAASLPGVHTTGTGERDVNPMPDATPVPPFSRPLPKEVADRITSTAAPQPRRRHRGRRFAALALAAGVLGGGISAALPAEPAQAAPIADPQMCWYKGWFLEGGVWYQGWFLEEC
jgi:hypothetical protein